MKRLLLALVAVAMIGFFTTQVNAQGHYRGHGHHGHHQHRSYYQPSLRYQSFNSYYGRSYRQPTYYRNYTRSYYSPGSYCSPYSNYRRGSGFSLYLGF